MNDQLLSLSKSGIVSALFLVANGEADSVLDGMDIGSAAEFLSEMDTLLDECREESFVQTRAIRFCMRKNHSPQNIRHIPEIVVRMNGQAHNFLSAVENHNKFAEGKVSADETREATKRLTENLASKISRLAVCAGLLVASGRISTDSIPNELPFSDIMTHPDFARTIEHARTYGFVSASMVFGEKPEGDFGGDIPHFHLSCFRSMPFVVEDCFRLGYDRDVFDDQGWTPMHYAACNRFHTLPALVSKGLMHVPDGDGFTPLDILRMTMPEAHDLKSGLEALVLSAKNLNDSTRATPEKTHETL